MSEPATHKRPNVVRGDTILPWSIAILIETVLADISSARMQFRVGKKLIHEMTTSIALNVVTIEQVEPAITELWPTETLQYDLEITLADGRVVTWLKGTQDVLQDRTY